MLEHYDVIIVVERMLESLAVLHFAFGLQPDELMFMQAARNLAATVRVSAPEHTSMTLGSPCTGCCPALL